MRSWQRNMTSPPNTQRKSLQNTKADFFHIKFIQKTTVYLIVSGCLFLYNYGRKEVMKWTDFEAITLTL